MTYQEELTLVGQRADSQVTGLQEVNATLTSDLDAADEQMQKQAQLIVVQAARIKELEDQPVPTPPKMVVGSTLNRAAGESLQDAFNRRRTAWGVVPEAVRTYETGIPIAFTLYGKSVNVVSIWKPPKEIIAGKHDVALHALFSSVTTAQIPKVRWSYKHEPEDDVESGAFTAEQWRNAFVYCADIADQYAPASKLPRGPIVMGWTIDPRSKRNLVDYIPVGARLDFIGWDIYTVTEAETKGAYQNIRDATTKLGLQTMICEAGMRAPNDHSDAETANFLRFSTLTAYQLGFVLYTYYDALMSEKDPQGRPYDFRLNTQIEYDAMADSINIY